MAGNEISRSSTNFFIASVLLVLFGAAAVNQGGQHGTVQLVLAAVMAGAGVLLRTGTAEARLAGLAAAGLTVAAGALLLVSGGFYVPGTIIAVFALFKLGPARAAVAAPPPELPTASAGFASPPAATSPAATPPAATSAGAWDYFGGHQSAAGDPRD